MRGSRGQHDRRHSSFDSPTEFSGDSLLGRKLPQPDGARKTGGPMLVERTDKPIRSRIPVSLILSATHFATGVQNLLIDAASPDRLEHHLGRGRATILIGSVIFLLVVPDAVVGTFQPKTFGHRHRNGFVYHSLFSRCLAW